MTRVMEEGVDLKSGGGESRGDREGADAPSLFIFYDDMIYDSAISPAAYSSISILIKEKGEGETRRVGRERGPVLRDGREAESYLDRVSA